MANRQKRVHVPKDFIRTGLAHPEILAAMRTLVVLAMDVAGDAIDEAIVEKFYSARQSGKPVHFKISVEKIDSPPTNPDAN